MQSLSMLHVIGFKWASVYIDFVPIALGKQGGSAVKLLNGTLSKLTPRRIVRLIMKTIVRSKGQWITDK